METYWIYVIVGVIVFLLVVAGVWYYVTRNQSKQLK
jgi:cbb3-type cytochrome oxidase subunit 3